MNCSDSMSLKSFLIWSSLVLVGAVCTDVAGTKLVSERAYEIARTKIASEYTGVKRDIILEDFKKSYEDNRLARNLIWGDVGGLAMLLVFLGVKASELNEGSRSEYNRVEDDSRSDRWQGGYGGVPG